MNSSLFRRLLLAVFVLVVAACNGGGCSSGCASCGTTPLPGGFPKAETVPNAGQVRVTRPGLDFVQANVGTLAQKLLATNGTGGVMTFDIPKASQSGASVCTPANPVAPQCQAEIDVGNAKLRVNAITPNRVKIDGLLPVRIRDLPVSFFGLNTYVVAGDSTKVPNLCASNLKGSPTFPYKEFPLLVELPLVTETRAPRDGYTKVDVDNAIIDIAITEADVEICDNTCGGACQFLTDIIKSIAFNSLVGGIKDQIKAALANAFCTRPTPTVEPSCPDGSVPNDSDPKIADKCLFAGTDQCVPALLGVDGRMDLGKALAAFSPGTQGGLDFVLASSGDMSPDPKVTTLPTWTPRKPPVPAEDNNANGISLSLLGGALPQPTTKCVDAVVRPPPQDIPVPAELKGDVITPWPAGTPGPHVGIALAGRYLDHALLGAYNSGLFCVGVSTEAVAQLSSGTLSLLAPSLKNLTLEQQSAAAAITTRPGAPPKLVLGGGTDVNADPLLALSLEKLSVDFYVFSNDRFVRVFTYTADVTVPINLQTGKTETNPNGGIVPVIGNLRLANATASNTDHLLFEDAKRLADGVTGLLGGLIGQFLGSGISPIDLQSALASTGLAIDIPAGGIRKLTAGSDAFVGIFANLQTAAGTAREESVTRASLLQKTVDAASIGLTTAERARFPKLVVDAAGVASRPTEVSWWIDRGTRSVWRPSGTITVDADAMLLQGKHVLYVTSRVVSETATEDATPVAIPFTIDTLAPSLEVRRDGGRALLKAWDFVSPASSLLVRHRVGDAPFGDFAPLDASAAVDGVAFVVPEGADADFEVKDEEGNIGTIRLALRGRADASLATGSGCDCGIGPRGAGSIGGVAFAAIALGLTVLAARRRARRARG